MKKMIFSLMLLATGAAQASSFVDYAKVVRSEPMYDRVTTQSCRNIPVTETTQPDEGAGTAGTVIGGLAGGLLGHQVGGGSGKTAATIVGAIGGAMVGRNIGERPSVTNTTRRECNQAYHDEITGYNVTYEYRGRRETITMPNDPGKRLQMRVTVEPVVQ